MTTAASNKEYNNVSFSNRPTTAISVPSDNSSQIKSCETFSDHVEISFEFCRVLYSKNTLQSHFEESEIDFKECKKNIKSNKSEIDRKKSKKKMKSEKYFHVEKPKAEFFRKYLVKKIKKILKGFKILQWVVNDSRVLIKYKARETKLVLAEARLEALKSHVMIYSIFLDKEFPDSEELLLVKNGLVMESMELEVHKFQAREDCIIYYDYENNSRPGRSSIKTINFIFNTRNFAHLVDYTRPGIPIDVIGSHLWETLNHLIKHQCLHIDNFIKINDKYLPNLKNDAIYKEAESLGVIVHRLAKFRGKEYYFTIKGSKEHVNKMKSFIYLQFQSTAVLWNVDKLNMRAAIAPPSRQTLEFLLYAACTEESFPSHWNLHLSPSTKESLLNNVSDSTKSAIERLMSQTWKKQLVGIGRDASGLRHSGIKIIDVKRIENPRLFITYSNERRLLLKRKYEQRCLCIPVDKLPGSTGSIMTVNHMDDILKTDLFHEINEHYLFHGTTPDVIDAIIQCGLDPRISNDSCMLGKGIYAAESSTKSDQYTGDSKQNRTMFLVRVLLGDVYVYSTKHKETTQLIRPPCKHCHMDKCNCPNQSLFDSVMLDGKCLFREFVVYDKNLCYPEYVITYRRV